MSGLPGRRNLRPSCIGADGKPDGFSTQENIAAAWDRHQTGYFATGLSAVAHLVEPKPVATSEDSPGNEAAQTVAIWMNLGLPIPEDTDPNCR
jgi:hypothetical protein